MRIALIDADILAYQAAAASEQAFDWGDGLWTLHSFESEAIAAFESSLERVKEKTQATKLVLAFSDKANWRKLVLSTYKANRLGVRKPMLLGFLRNHAEAKYDCRSITTLEGDDILGMTATAPLKADIIICSLDKDLKTIPGNHYNFGKDEFFTITEEEANYWHMVQTLTGDTTDGYAGCPGVGPKTAETILANAEKSPWENVVAAYVKRGLSEEEALVQARVARILRHEEYDFENNQVRLWTPN